MLYWRKVVSYSVAVFAAQFLTGFLEGLLLPQSTPVLFSTQNVASSLVSLAFCVAIFTHLALNQADRTLEHAALTALFQLVLGMLLHLVLPMWLPTADAAEVGLEILVVVAALAIGTVLGTKIRNRHATRAEA